MEYPDFKVCVRCFTYNQSKYIIETLNGFAIQQTTFPFVCCIVDDASTDGEQEVIKKYVEENFDLTEESCHFERETDYAFITYAQHKINNNCFFAVIYLKENYYRKKKTKLPLLSEWRDKCEYEAICEGDDYWIISNKLQMQVDYLDAHSECGLVRTDVNRLSEDGRIENSIFRTTEFHFMKDTISDYLINGWFAAPCTWVYRMRLLNNPPVLNSAKYFKGDLFILLHILEQSSIHFIPQTMAVYRVLQNSASHFTLYKDLFAFKQKMKNTRIYFSRSQPLSIRMNIWYHICIQRIPPRSNVSFFIPWIWICLESFVRLLFKCK